MIAKIYDKEYTVHYVNDAKAVLRSLLSLVSTRLFRVFDFLAQTF